MSRASHGHAQPTCPVCTSNRLFLIVAPRPHASRLVVAYLLHLCVSGFLNFIMPIVGQNMETQELGRDPRYVSRKRNGYNKGSSGLLSARLRS